MKPQQIDEIVAAHGARDRQGAVLISILAGVEEATLAERFPGPAIVRAMPNLPVALGKGVVALHARAAPQSAKDAVAALMAPLGLVEWTDDEAMYGALGTLEGCGPAFLFRFIDALAKAGEALGIPADQARGSRWRRSRARRRWRRRRTRRPRRSPTASPAPADRRAQGLNVLDRDDALVKLLTETLAAAERRGARWRPKRSASRPVAPAAPNSRATNGSARVRRRGSAPRAPPRTRSPPAAPPWYRRSP